MSSRARLITTAVVVLAAAVPSVRSAAGAPYDLDGPLVTKVGWSTRAMTARDLDGDGRTDLALLDNERARIILLYSGKGDPAHRMRATSGRWEPVLDDAPFVRQTIPTGVRMYALAAGDLDGDGRTDLAYSGSPDGLTVRYQRTPGDFSHTRVLDVADPASWAPSLLAADMDGDGRDDLLVMTPSELLVWRQGEDGELRGPRSYALLADTSYGPRLLDVDGDGRLDLVYQVANSDDALRLRAGLPGGGLGPEVPFHTGALRGLVAPLRRAAGEPPEILAIRAATGELEILQLAHDGEPHGLLKGVHPRLFASRVGSKTPASYAFGDLDGDGHTDIAVADPHGSRIWVTLQPTPGSFSEPVAYPSLQDVRSIAAADLDGDGRAELVVASPNERTVAWTGLAASGRLAYPQPLPSVGRPHAVVARDLDGDGRPEVAFAHDDSDGRGVTVLRRDVHGAWAATTLALSDVRTAPRGLTVADVDGDGRPDLVVLLARQPARIVRVNPDGSLTEVAGGPAYHGALVDDLEPSQVAVADIDGDGADELMVTGESFTRALRLTGAGALEVRDQYNPRAADARLAGAAALDLDGDGVRELVQVAADGDTLEVLARDRHGVYRSRESLPLGGLDLVATRVLDLDGNGADDLLLLGSERFVWLPVGRRDLELETVARHEPELEGMSYTDVAVGDLDGDGEADVAALDARDSRVLEVLRPRRHGPWPSGLHFTVFETDPHYEGQRGTASEPREMLVTDIDGDGRDDLVLLVHDRVLLYRQVPPKP